MNKCGKNSIQIAERRSWFHVKTQLLLKVSSKLYEVNESTKKLPYHPFLILKRESPRDTRECYYWI